MIDVVPVVAPGRSATSEFDPAMTVNRVSNLGTQAEVLEVLPFREQHGWSPLAPPSALQDPVFDFPTATVFREHALPAGQVLAVEQRGPARGGGGACSA